MSDRLFDGEFDERRRFEHASDYADRLARAIRDAFEINAVPPEIAEAVLDIRERAAQFDSAAKAIIQATERAYAERSKAARDANA